MQRVGRHTIGRDIGAPGLLATYEARHDDGRSVWLRVVTVAVEPSASVVKRFEDDLARAAALAHPGVLPPVEWSAEDPIHVSTLPVRAASLATVCAPPRVRLDPSVVAGVGADVAGALVAAHGSGLVHAGLSPDNVLLGADGSARVTDFGLARFLTSMSSAYSQVMRGAVESLAPEQLSAPDTVGPATDVFGLGVLLYRALTGKEPFEATSAIGVSIRLKMGKVTPIESHGVAIPPVLAELVTAMLAAAPARRPSMNDVTGKLAALAQGPWRDAMRTLVEAAAPELGAAQTPAASASATAGSEPAAPSAPLAAAPPSSPSGAHAAPPVSASLTSTPPAPAPGPAPAPASPPSATLAPASPLAPAPAPPPAAPPFGAPAGAAGSFGAPSPVASPNAASFGSPMAAPAPLPPVASISFGGPSVAPAATPRPQREIDYRPTIRDSGPLVDEREIPDYLRDLDRASVVNDPSAPAWPTSADAPMSVPKTVVMFDPRSASLEAARKAAPAPAPPPAPTPDAPHTAPPPRGGGGFPEWLLWAAIAAGAFALLGGTVVLVIVLTS